VAVTSNQASGTKARRHHPEEVAARVSVSRRAIFIPRSGRHWNTPGVGGWARVSQVLDPFHRNPATTGPARGFHCLVNVANVPSLMMPASDAELTPASGEDELVRRARDDANAFATLYRRHEPAIARYLRRRVGDREVARDLVAETFLAALEGIGRYRLRGASFRGWLYRLASTRVSRWARRRALAGKRVALELDTEVEAEAGDSEGLLAERARAALLELPARYQTALALHYVEGLSVDEIASALSCRPGTVKARLSRGRERLRLKLEPYREEFLR
jgi:RNA polymerase sigma-70 factor (ECF subfamily)